MRRRNRSSAHIDNVVLHIRHGLFVGIRPLLLVAFELTRCYQPLRNRRQAEAFGDLRSDVIEHEVRIHCRPDHAAERALAFLDNFLAEDRDKWNPLAGPYALVQDLAAGDLRPVHRALSNGASVDDIDAFRNLIQRHRAAVGQSRQLRLGDLDPPVLGHAYSALREPVILNAVAHRNQIGCRAGDCLVAVDLPEHS